MSALAALRSRSVLDAPMLTQPSSGASADSILTGKRLLNMRRLLSNPVEQLRQTTDTVATGDLAVKLNSKVVAMKQLVSVVAMHLDNDWRRRLFDHLDVMFDPDEWDSEFALPSEKSFSTFIRMIIYLHPTKRPSIGLSPNGNFLSAWRNGNDRITIECLADDEVRWSLSRTLDGDRELGAGRVQIHRVPDVTQAYEPEALFNDGHRLLA